MAKDEMNNEKETGNKEQAEGTEKETVKEEVAIELTPEQKFAELNDKYLRLYADFDNFRKRSMKERIEYLKYAGEEVYKDMLPVVDDLERSIRANENITDSGLIKEGVLLIFSKLHSILKQKGIEPMDTKGKEFDAETMEAITNIPAPTPDLKGKVIDEVEKGYMFNGKVIRYAKVVVGS